MLPVLVETKLCRICFVEKTLTSFSKNKRAKDGLQSQCKLCDANRYQSNREHKLGIAKKYRIANREKVNTKISLWREKNREKAALFSREWRKVNRDRVKENKLVYYRMNKDKIAVVKRIYRQTPTAKAIERNSKHKRRSVTKNGTVSKIEMCNLYRHAIICYWCGTALHDTTVHIDHYIPLSRGGEHSLSNLVTSCKSCNLRKSAKSPVDFMRDQNRIFVKKFNYQHIIKGLRC